MLSYTKNSLDLTVRRVLYKRTNMKRYITLLFTLFLALQSVTAQRVIIIGANPTKAKTPQKRKPTLPMLETNASCASMEVSTTRSPKPRWMHVSH